MQAASGHQPSCVGLAQSLLWVKADICSVQKGMSALPPDNADIHERDRHVRLVPIADIA